MHEQQAIQDLVRVVTMSLTTRCIHCQTVFRITLEQLQAHGGQVRCGRCMKVFNGLDVLARHIEDQANNTTRFLIMSPHADTSRRSEHMMTSFVFEVREGYLIEDGKLTAPVLGASLVGNAIASASSTHTSDSCVPVSPIRRRPKSPSGQS